MKIHSRILAVPVLLACVAVASCDSATPTAPTGATLVLSANPNEIPLDGFSTITIEARRENGTPVNPGTEIRLSSTLGVLEAEVVTTDDTGVARTRLNSDGRIGQADLIARSGPSESNMVMVSIGRLASAVSLQTTPSTVSENGGSISLLALVRDDQGQPLPGVSVNFRANVGTLQSRGSFVSTNNRGEASDRLTVSAEDLLVLAGDDFNVEVEASGGGGAVQSDQATISIAREPEASFTFTVNLSQLQVAFTDTSLGRPREWLWDFGDGSAMSSLQNPSRTYAAEGDYTVTLTVTNLIGSSTTSQVVRVRNN